jgi:dTDP-glucose 4,6-dehydratase
MIVVTGGAGFIGSQFVLTLFRHNNEEVVNIDALTYASNISILPTDSKHTFIQGNIQDRSLMDSILKRRPRVIVNFAAETHVDRSINDSFKFLESNITGTYTLLESVRMNCPDSLFIHVSTDEVYGSLNPDDEAFTELHQYQPSSPYSATKAASDHLVNAWHRTYGLNTIITNCSNNYGAFQYPEKLIPLTIARALEEKSIPIYGNGQQVRDWIHVEDHCSAIQFLIDRGQPGEQYNIGANNELTNIVVVNKICSILDQMKPRANGESYSKLIEHVRDRPGHDTRYALNTEKINSLGWYPSKDFDQEIKKIIKLKGNK